MIVEIDGKKYFDRKLISLIRERKYKEMRSYLDNVTNLNDTTDSPRRTLLHLSVTSKDVVLTQNLINRGCMIDPLDEAGETPMIKALQYECYYQVGLLLAANADFNATNQRGTTALSWLFQLGNSLDELNILKILVDKLMVKYRNEEELAKTLIDARCPLDKVVYFNSPSLLKRMLEHGYEVNEQHDNNLNSTALHVAAMLNYPEVMRVLLQFGADVSISDECGYLPISHYVEKHSEQDPDLIEALMPRSFNWSNETVEDFNKERLSLYYIFTKGKKETLRLFQSRCYDIDYSATDEMGETPLHYLMRNKNHDILESVANTKLDVNARGSRFQMTALHLVADLGDPVYMKFLLDKGADVNLGEIFGQTPLWVVIKNILGLKDNVKKSAKLKKFEKCVELLMLNGADAEATTIFNSATVFRVIAKAKIFKFIKPVLANVALLDISGELKKDQTRNEIYTDDESKGYYEICKQQLEDTKRLCLHGTVTVYKILTEHEEKVALYTRGQNIDELITKNFPLESYYKKLLHKRLSEAAKINDLRSNVARLLADIMGWSDPSHLIIDKIVCMLKISDLQGFKS